MAQTKQLRSIVQPKNTKQVDIINNRYAHDA